MFLDMSATYDCVKHETLIKKLELYSFGVGTCKLILSYLLFRLQFVSIGGHPSNFKWIRTGVPQGSNLGPFMFNLYTQEMGSVLLENCDHIDMINNSENLFGQDCDLCGSIITFADDATIVLKAKRGQCLEMSHKLHNLLNNLEIFLKANILQLNIDKTQLLRVTPRQ